MKLKIDADGYRTIHLSFPRWLYMNGFAVSMLAMKKEVLISARQARKSLRAVKKAMHKNSIETMCTIDVTTGDTHVHIEV